MNKFEDEKNPARRAARILRQSGATDAAYRLAGEILFKAYTHRLTAFLYRKFKVNPADAEEHIANTVQQFLARPPSSAGAEEAWLYTVVEREALDWIRRKRAQKRGGGAIEASIEEMAEDDEGPGIEIGDTLDDPGRRLAVADCMEKSLKQFEIKAPTYLRVLALFADGATTAEIAQELGISLTAATTRVYEAREKARQIFKDCKE